MTWGDAHKALFNKELQTLKSAMADIEDEKFSGNELMPKYREVVKEYKRLLDLTRKIFKISDTQGRDLKRRENEIKNLLDNSNQGFLTFGKDLLVDRQYSAECIRIFGKHIGNLNILELISSENKEQNEILSEIFYKLFKTNDLTLQLSYLNMLPQIIKICDNYINIKYRIIEHEDHDMENNIIMLILTDITEKRKTEDEILYLSYHDKLTSLYNRVYIDSITPQLQTPSNMPMSIILADMNGLKLTNDVFGHEVGDRLLINAAKIFMKCCRKSDIVARWGGDEFLILLPGTDSVSCEKICRRIKQMCHESEDNPIELSVSLGTATMENSITNVRELFNVAESMMYSNKMIESKDIRRKIISSIEKNLYEKSCINPGHVERIMLMAVHFAKYLGIDENSDEFIHLLRLAELHEIGKAAIPKEILGKPGQLTPNEWKIMQSYTEIGFRMAMSLEEPILAQAILSMGERWDGQGYPKGLKEEEIPFITRIIAIIDAYDLMTHESPYKEKMSKEEAMEELCRGKGTQFDPRLVKIFLDNIHQFTRGNYTK